MKTTTINTQTNNKNYLTYILKTQLLGFIFKLFSLGQVKSLSDPNLTAEPNLNSPTKTLIPFLGPLPLSLQGPAGPSWAPFRLHQGPVQAPAGPQQGPSSPSPTRGPAWLGAPPGPSRAVLGMGQVLEPGSGRGARTRGRAP